MTTQQFRGTLYMQLHAAEFATCSEPSPYRAVRSLSYSVLVNVIYREVSGVTDLTWTHARHFEITHMMSAMPGKLRTNLPSTKKIAAQSREITENTLMIVEMSG